MRTTKRYKWIGLGLAMFFSFFMAFLFSDCTLCDRSVQTTRRAAIVIRGPNDFIQQGITKYFTLKVLGSSYQEVSYYSQRTEGDHKTRFLQKLSSYLKRYPATDIFLLSHGTRRFLSWVEDGVGVNLRKKIRLVYHSGCSSYAYGDDWMKAGASTYVGHGKGLSWSPVFFYFFLRRWVRGYDVTLAVDQANQLAHGDMRAINIVTLGLIAGEKSRKATRAITFGDTGVYLDLKAPKLLAIH